MHVFIIAAIVQVRTPEEFAKNHFPKAINIPFRPSGTKINELKELPQSVIAY